jgi:hypothetical protein
MKVYESLEFVTSSNNTELVYALLNKINDLEYENKKLEIKNNFLKTCERCSLNDNYKDCKKSQCAGFNKFKFILD